MCDIAFVQFNPHPYKKKVSAKKQQQQKKIYKSRFTECELTDAAANSISFKIIEALNEKVSME